MKFFFQLTAAILLLYGFSGCAGKSAEDPLDAIPEGARKVTVMNLTKIAAANGAPTLLQPGGELTPQARRALEIALPGGMLQPVAAVLYDATAPAVNPAQTLVLTTSGGYDAIIFKVTDYDRLTSGTLSSFHNSDADFGDYRVFEIGRRTAAVSRHLCIIAPDLATCRLIAETSPGKFLESNPGPGEWLRQGDNALTSVCMGEEFPREDLKGLWVCGALRFTDTSMALEIKAMTEMGKTDSIGERIAAPIDPSIARFVPQGATFVAATGLQPEGGADPDLYGLITRYIPGEAPVSPTGSSLVYGRPAGTVSKTSLLDASKWNLASVIRMPQEDADMAMAGMKRLTDGLSKYDSESGFFTYTDGENTISFGYTDGYFAQGVNGPLSATNANAYSADLEGSRLTAILDIPSDSPLRTIAGLPCGATLVVKVATDKINCKLTFYNSRLKPLANLDATELLRPMLPRIFSLQ